MIIPTKGFHTGIWNRNWLIFIALFTVPFIYFLNIYACSKIYDFTNGIAEFDLSGYKFEILTFFYIAFTIWVVASYKLNDFILRILIHSFPIAKGDEPEAFNIIEDYCATLGIERPRIDLIDTPFKNALSYGVNKGSYALILTKGLVTDAPKNILKSVIAQELIQIKTGVTRVLTLFNFYVNAPFYLLLPILLYSSDISAGFISYTSSEDISEALGIFLILSFVLNYLFFGSLRILLQRIMESQSDAKALALTKDPEGYIQALTTLGRQEINYIGIPLFLSGFSYVDHGRFLGLINYHPSQAKRIKNIRERINVYE